MAGGRSVTTDYEDIVIKETWRLINERLGLRDDLHVLTHKHKCDEQAHYIGVDIFVSGGVMNIRRHMNGIVKYDLANPDCIDNAVDCVVDAVNTMRHGYNFKFYVDLVSGLRKYIRDVYFRYDSVIIAPTVKLCIDDGIPIGGCLGVYLTGMSNGDSIIRRKHIRYDTRFPIEVLVRMVVETIDTEFHASRKLYNSIGVAKGVFQ